MSNVQQESLPHRNSAPEYSSYTLCICLYFEVLNVFRKSFSLLSGFLDVSASGLVVGGTFYCQLEPGIMRMTALIGAEEAH